MAGELDAEEEIKDQDGDELRVFQDFKEKANLTAIIFSGKTPRAIVERLKFLLKTHCNVVPQLHSKKWKLTYKLLSEHDDASEERKIEPESCLVQVNILNIAGEANKAVEFKKISGSARFFYEQFTTLKVKFAE